MTTKKEITERTLTCRSNLEDYISNHTESRFSHGICPECLEKNFPQYMHEQE